MFSRELRMPKKEAIRKIFLLRMIPNIQYIHNLHAPVPTYTENYLYTMVWGMGVGGITLQQQQQQYSTICTSDYPMSHLYKINCKKHWHTTEAHVHSVDQTHAEALIGPKGDREV